MSANLWREVWRTAVVVIEVALAVSVAVNIIAGQFDRAAVTAGVLALMRIADVERTLTAKIAEAAAGRTKESNIVIKVTADTEQLQCALRDLEAQAQRVRQKFDGGGAA